LVSVDDDFDVLDEFLSAGGISRAAIGGEEGGRGEFCRQRVVAADTHFIPSGYLYYLII